MSFNLPSFKENAKSKDKDHRYMALNDLKNEFEKESFKPDENTIKQLSEIVLTLLSDSSSEVQGMAVKNIEPLIKRMTGNQLESWIGTLGDKLCDKDNEESRDISSISLKVIVQKIPAELASQGILKCIASLIKGLKSSEIEIKSDSLDIFEEILKRFGAILAKDHAELQKLFINELKGEKMSVRKKAIACLASLSVHTSETLFKELITLVMNGIEKNSTGDNLRTYILAVSALSKLAGQRFGPYLKKTVEILLQITETIAEKETEDEVRENIMQAFESFIYMCGEEFKKSVDVEHIIIIAKDYLEYDPFYAYDSSGDEKEEEEEEEGGSGDEEGNASDDDDMTWKVRKSAARTIIALIKTRPDLLQLIYKEMCSEEDYQLLSCFKEREESVKLDILDAYDELLHQTVSNVNDKLVQKKEASYIKSTLSICMSRIKKQLKDKSQKRAKIRQKIFTLLNTLVLTLNGGLEDHAAFLIDASCATLNSKTSTSTLKQECLTFLKNYLGTHNPSIFTEYIGTLSKGVYACVQERYYKVISAALNVCSSLVFVVEKLKEKESFKNLSKDLYTNIFDRLSLQDIDQDVKEAAIEAAGTFISVLGSKMEKETQDTIKVLFERTSNDITRLIASKTLGVIAKAKIDFGKLFTKIVSEIASFLKKDNRTLRQTCLSTLTIFTNNYEIQLDSFQEILTEISSCLSFTSDKDLTLTYLCLDLVCNIHTKNGKTIKDIEKLILPKILGLLQSSTLQGQALTSSLNVLKILVPSVGYSTLLKQVLDQLKVENVTKQNYINVGKSVAILVSVGPEKESANTISDFAKHIKSNDDDKKLLGLFTIGEIGLIMDLSSYGVREDIESCFENENEKEEIKNAASFSLGNISVGNLSKYLPQIIKNCKNSKKKYLLLSSLKEIITQAPAEKIKPFIEEILPLLFENASVSEGGIPNVVAECLGKLCVIDYTSVMKELKKNLDSESKQVQTTVVSAVKYTVSEHQRSYDAELKKDIFAFLGLLSRETIHQLRRACVLLLTSAIYNKRVLVEDSLSDVISNVYQETVTDEKLIETINLGPFKHTVDNGEDLRKSTFECLDTILDLCPNRIDLNKFCAQFTNGLLDRSTDIRMLTFTMINKTCLIAPSSVLSCITEISDGLKDTLSKTLKENAVQTEKERHSESLRGALKTVNALSQLKGIQDSIAFQDLLTKTIKPNNNLQELYESIQKKNK